jgi:ubiquinone/menaquinone biosynthesis C-methylase UbiE
MEHKSVEKTLSELEKTYDKIAEYFSKTREYFWDELSFIKKYANPGDNILDYGCGNGRLLYLLAKEKINYFGVDSSGKLLDAAGKHWVDPNIKFSKIPSNQISLPFPDEFFNAVYMIGVMHHFPGADLRLKVAREMFRLVKPEGYAVVTVWDIWRTKYARYVFKNWLNKVLGKSELDWNDGFTPFRYNEETVYFYYHAFFPKELENIFRKSGFTVIRSDRISRKNRKNILLIAKK